MSTKQPSEKALAAAREWLIKNVAPAKPMASPPFVGYTIAGKVDAVEGFALALDAFAAEAVRADRKSAARKVYLAAFGMEQVLVECESDPMVLEHLRPTLVRLEAAIRARGKE